MTFGAQQQLGTSRYAHSRRYLAQKLEAASLAILRSDEVVLRSEFCKPTQEIGVLAHRLPRRGHAAVTLRYVPPRVDR